jgi:hypothetical protein
MAIFYRQNEGKYVRAMVLMQPTASKLQHSVLSARFASIEKVKKRANRRLWVRQ